MANEHRGQEKVWHFNGKRHNGGGEGGQASNFLEGKLSIGKMIEPKKNQKSTMWSIMLSSLVIVTTENYMKTFLFLLRVSVLGTHLPLFPLPCPFLSPSWMCLTSISSTWLGIPKRGHRGIPGRSTKDIHQDELCTRENTVILPPLAFTRTQTVFTYIGLS